MNKPLISVVLPIYNVEAYLPVCMNSLLNQTYDNLEFIMVDDGSKKTCADMCDSYLKQDTRIVVHHKENGGLSDARNYGIDRAKGDYITCVDPDDYVDDDYIEYLYRLLTKYKARMSIAQHRVKYDNGSVRENGRLGDELIETETCIERMLYHDTIDTSAWAKLYHRSLFEKVRYPRGRLFEDIATTYKLMMQCDYIAVGYESKYNYIFHDNSIVNGTFKPAKLDLIEMTDQMAVDVVKRYPGLKKAALRRQVYSRFSTLNQMLNVDGYLSERKEIVDFIKANKKTIMRDTRAPKRDKLALSILAISFRLYRLCWIKYREKIMGD